MKTDVGPDAVWDPANLPYTGQDTFNYQQLCALLVYLGGPYADGAVPTEALDLLIKAGLYTLKKNRAQPVVLSCASGHFPAYFRRVVISISSATIAAKITASTGADDRLRPKE